MTMYLSYEQLTNHPKPQLFWYELGSGLKHIADSLFIKDLSFVHDALSLLKYDIAHSPALYTQSPQMFWLTSITTPCVKQAGQVP